MNESQSALYNLEKHGCKDDNSAQSVVRLCKIYSHSSYGTYHENDVEPLAHCPETVFIIVIFASVPALKILFLVFYHVSFLECKMTATAVTVLIINAEGLADTTENVILSVNSLHTKLPIALCQLVLSLVQRFLVGNPFFG